MKSKGRVAMLMSGGVDSSVAAALLKQQGYEVLGFYILGWTGTKEFPCNWQVEESDARKVADEIGIPFYTVNLSEEYEREVIDRFFALYQSGITPNPDILCNKEIKFKAFWRKIRQFETDFIATGHYAKIIQTKNAKGQILKIAKAKDRNKDQSYFLWGIERGMIPKIIFPLGELTKPEVRKLARQFHLVTATKKDSQGICFVGPLKVRHFLSSRLNTQPGSVYLSDGRKIATHSGAELYTIGQHLAAGAVSWTGDVPPLYVVAKDIKHNRLVVGHDRETFASKLTASQVNWLAERPSDKFAALAKIRYRQEDVPARIVIQGNELLVQFKHPVRAITAGQSIVFYSTQGELLGGAIISAVDEQDAAVERLTKISSKAQV